jgi:hypothetical protein
VAVAAQPVVAPSGAPQGHSFVESPEPLRHSRFSAVMVVRNEEAVIARKLENLLSLDYPQAKLDVVVVSDGSSDRTPLSLPTMPAIPRSRAHPGCELC